MLDQKNFQKTQSKIENFLNKHNLNQEAFKDRNYKLQTTDAIFCTKDSVRNKQFRNAIESVIDKKNKSDLIFVDAGAGTWILGLFALILWVKKCYFIEQNPYSLQLSKDLIKYFWYIDKSIFLCEDACKTKLNEKFDVLISETVTSGFVQEDFIWIIKNLKQFAKPNAIFLPQSFELEIIEKPSWISQKIHIESKNLSNKIINLKNKNTSELEFKMDANIFWNFWLKCWETISFLNPRTLKTSDTHTLFIFK